MRVLLIAEACNPQLSSEPLVGFNACESIAKHVEEAVVVTAIRNKPGIEKYGQTNARYLFIDNEWISSFCWKLNQFLKLGADFNAVIDLPKTFSFENAVWRLLKKELKNGEFDVVHRVTPISAAVPSPFARKSPVPYILGPINGGLPYPREFRSTQLKEREWLRFFRKLYRLIPYTASTHKKSSVFLASFPHTRDTLPLSTHGRIIDVPENGVDSARFKSSERNPYKERCQFLFVGRLVPFKCAEVNILAFASSKVLRQHELIIIGDGPERCRLESLVKKHGLEGCVTIMGQIPQKMVAKYMSEADVFAFPSIRDSGAGVLAEAMMSGLPSVTVDYGPPRYLLTGNCGIKVPLGTIDSHIVSFRKAMEQLADNGEKRIAMGEASRLRAQKTLDWNVKSLRIRQVYDWILGKRSDKPDFYSEAPVI